LKKCDFLTQKLGIKKDPDPKLFIPDPDPDPSKSSGSDRIRIRIHNTDICNRGLQFYTFFGISIGITRRMIDIGKKITFYFLQNV
jgi:hypothetical protein